MSALNVVKQRDRVVVVTDAAVYNIDTGVITGFGTKQATLPHLPAVIATRGSPLAVPLYANLLGFKFKSFDELVANIESVIRDVHAAVKKLCLAHDGHPGADEPLDICGWSAARSRPESYTISVPNEVSATTLEDETPEGKARKPKRCFFRA